MHRSSWLQVFVWAHSRHEAEASAVTEPGQKSLCADAGVRERRENANTMRNTPDIGPMYFVMDHIPGYDFDA